VIQSTRSDERFGYACLSHHRPIDGTAYFGVVLRESVWGTIASFEAMFLAIDYIFRCWDLRMLYGEMTATNFESVASGEGKWFETVARLRRQQYVNGQYEDVIVLQIVSALWNKRAGPYRRFLHVL
jgi:RimJ/RimL family protein N-acetyltransferase